MNHVNFVVMGKTGAGKSTLINAILQEDLAPTGTGQAITRQNHLYTTRMLLPSCSSSSPNGGPCLAATTVNLYDTVGLEIDPAVTQATLLEIRGFLDQAQQCRTQDERSMVWFCVNAQCSRFEPFEIALIRSLSIEYEIPFLIVLTQCYSEEQGDLERQIRTELPEVLVARVLAKEFKWRGGVVPAHGVMGLLLTSVMEYDKAKVHLLESKLDQLACDRLRRIDTLRNKCQKHIDSCADKAMKIGFVPGGCIPIVHGICISMISSLNKTVGIDSTKGFAAELFSNAVVGLIATPFMGVPLLSAAVAYGYVSAVGECYLDSLMCVISRSTDEELTNNDLMSRRIKAELAERKK